MPPLPPSNDNLSSVQSSPQSPYESDNTRRLLRSLADLRDTLEVRVNQLEESVALLRLEAIRLEVDMDGQQQAQDLTPRNAGENLQPANARPIPVFTSDNAPDRTGVVTTSAIATEVSNLSRPITAEDINRLLERASQSLTISPEDATNIGRFALNHRRATNAAAAGVADGVDRMSEYRGSMAELEGTLTSLRRVREGLTDGLGHLDAASAQHAALRERLRERHRQFRETRAAQLQEPVTRAGGAGTPRRATRVGHSHDAEAHLPTSTDRRDLEAKGRLAHIRSKATPRQVVVHPGLPATNVEAVKQRGDPIVVRSATPTPLPASPRSTTANFGDNDDLGSDSTRSESPLGNIGDPAPMERHRVSRSAAPPPGIAPPIGELNADLARTLRQLQLNRAAINGTPADAPVSPPAHLPESMREMWPAASTQAAIVAAQAAVDAARSSASARMDQSRVRSTPPTARATVDESLTRRGQRVMRSIYETSDVVEPVRSGTRAPSASQPANAADRALTYEEAQREVMAAREARLRAYERYHALLHSSRSLLTPTPGGHGTVTPASWAGENVEVMQVRARDDLISAQIRESQAVATRDWTRSPLREMSQPVVGRSNGSRTPSGERVGSVGTRRTPGATRINDPTPAPAPPSGTLSNLSAQATRSAVPQRASPSSTPIQITQPTQRLSRSALTREMMDAEQRLDLAWAELVDQQERLMADRARGADNDQVQERLQAMERGQREIARAERSYRHARQQHLRYEQTVQSQRDPGELRRRYEEAEEWRRQAVRVAQLAGHDGVPLASAASASNSVAAAAEAPSGEEMISNAFTRAAARSAQSEARSEPPSRGDPEYRQRRLERDRIIAEANAAIVPRPFGRGTVGRIETIEMGSGDSEATASPGLVLQATTNPDSSAGAGILDALPEPGSSAEVMAPVQDRDGAGHSDDHVLVVLQVDSDESEAASSSEEEDEDSEDEEGDEDEQSQANNDETDNPDNSTDGTPTGAFHPLPTSPGQAADAMSDPSPSGPAITAVGGLIAASLADVDHLHSGADDSTDKAAERATSTAAMSPEGKDELKAHLWPTSALGVKKPRKHRPYVSLLDL